MFQSLPYQHRMAAEEVLKLFDFYWFEQRLFATKQPSPTQTSNHPLHEIHEELEEPKLPHKTLQVRSLSDRVLGSKISFSSDSLSPNSVIPRPKLKSVLSGKEIGEISKPEAKKEVVGKKRPVARRKNISSSKSLSELEFEELKGFMDLGFVFSEDDKDSNLVSIVPGLQRLERKADEKANDGNLISRPYLSEAWGILDRKRANESHVDWRIEGFHDKINMKDHLRAWAQTVASSVRL